MSYTVKILSSDNFDKLPFERAKTSLGAADPKNRTAYIRDTGYNDITKGTISHELDELMQEKSPHEVDGIRYKDFSQSFGNFGSSLPVIGKAAGPVLGAVGGIGDLFGSGMSKVGLPSFNMGNPSVSQFSNQVKADKLSGFGTGSGSTSTFGDAFRSGVNKDSSASAARNTVPTPSGRASSSASFLNQMMPKDSLSDMFSGIRGTSTPSAPAQTQEATGGGFTDFLSNLFVGKEGEQTTLQKSLPGALTALLGGMAAPKAGGLDFGGVRDDLRSRMGAEGGSPAYDLGFGEAKRIIDDPFGVVPQEMFDPIDFRLKENITALESRFRSAQGGGALSESDTSQFGRLRAQLVDQAEKEKAQLEFAYKQQQQENKIVTMKELLRLDSAQFEQYAQLANLEIAEIVEQYGVDVRTASEFKQLFGGIGEAMIQGALNPQTATA